MHCIMLCAGTVDFSDFLTMMTVKMSEKDSKEEILKAFRLFDDDETGKISFKNLKRVAKELGENLTDEELQASVLCVIWYMEVITRLFSYHTHISSLSINNCPRHSI